MTLMPSILRAAGEAGATLPGDAAPAGGLQVSTVLIIVMAVLFACGVYAMLERSLTRVLIGFLLLGNATNLMLLIIIGPPGYAPFFGGEVSPEEMSDPLPQAMVLTAIVITMAVAAFVLTLAYRSFQLDGHDEVADDVEDARIRELADQDGTSESYEDTTFSTDIPGAVTE